MKEQIKNIFLTTSLMFAFCISNAQDKKPFSESGQFSLGVRTTNSVFTDAGTPGMGFGGQFRIRMNKRVNTDWFADYLTTNLQGLGYRRDAHIGWSVLFYLTKDPIQVKKLSPFILAGHCFDYTNVYSIQTGKNEERKSSAVQMGIGTHYNFTDRFDATLMAQYMNHLGGELHTNVTNENGIKKLEFEKHPEIGLEGHLLITLSLNYRIANLWRK